MNTLVRIDTGAGQPWVLHLPTGSGDAARLVVSCHGAGEIWSYISDPAITWPRLRDTARYLAERGYAVCTPALMDMSLGSPGQTWGNDASTTQLASVITAAKALPGVSTGPYALLGTSMGGVTALNHARRVSYSGIAGILGLAPAVAISPYRGTDAAPGGSYTYVNAAYGVTTDSQWETAKPPYEPLNFGSSITFPVGIWTNSNDLIATPGLADAFAATNSTYITRTNLGSSAGTYGHDFDLVVPELVHEWLDGLVW